MKKLLNKFVAGLLILGIYSPATFSAEVRTDVLKLKPGTLPGTGTNGQLRVDSSDNKLKKYNETASAWQEISGSGSGGGVNFITNPSAEADASGWTGSSATVARVATSGYQFNGTASFAVTSATHTATVRTADITLNKPYADGGNCEAWTYYKGDASKWQLELRSSSGTSVLSSVALTNATTWQKSSSIYYPCTDAARIYFTSTASSPADFYFAGVQWGPVSAIGSVSQSTLYGTADGFTASSCNWSVNTGNWDNMPVDSDCSLPTVTGGLAQPSSKRPAFRMLAAPPGKYVVKATFQTYTTSGNSSLSLYDGTTRVGRVQNAGNSDLQVVTLVGVFEYTTAGDRAIDIQCRSGGNACEITANSVYLDVSFTVERFPLTSQTIYNPATAFPVSSAVMPNASNCTYTYTSTSNGTFSADNDCTTPTVTGSASAPSTKIPGITFASLPAGSYQVSMTGNWQSGTNGCVYTLYDGTSYYNASYMQAGSHNGTRSTVVTYAAAQSNITFQVGARAESGATCSLNNSTGGVYGSAGDIQFRIDVVALTQNIPAPILIGSVTSASTGPLRVEYVDFGGASLGSNCTSSPCTIYVKSSTNVVDVTRSGTGLYQVNFLAGTFSSRPACFVTPGEGQFRLGVPTAAITATAVPIESLSPSGGTFTDGGLNVMCIGPR